MRIPDLYDLEVGGTVEWPQLLPAVIQKHLDVGNYVPSSVVEEHLDEKLKIFVSGEYFAAVVRGLGGGAVVGAGGGAGPSTDGPCGAPAGCVEDVEKTVKAVLASTREQEAAATAVSMKRVKEELETAVGARIAALHDAMQEELAELFLSEKNEGRDDTVARAVDEIRQRPELLILPPTAKTASSPERRWGGREDVFSPRGVLVEERSTMDARMEAVEEWVQDAEHRLRNKLQNGLDERIQELTAKATGESEQEETQELMMTSIATEVAANLAKQIERLLTPLQYNTRLARFVWRGTGSLELCKRGAKDQTITKETAIPDEEDRSPAVHANLTRGAPPPPPVEEHPLKIPWEVELSNTQPDNFVWDSPSATHILVKEGGLYLVATAMFGGHSPKLSVFLDDRVQLERWLEDEQPQEATGLSIVEYFVLPGESKISVRFECDQKLEDEFPPEGFLELRKL